ncbi:hypothetical protein L596_004802 [Steinernema carpocapsae]|uniref:Uncharacterized protein n=1 Tax=Steinernema carpocapsae TaxID=34508 RepID=A0A4U8UYI8_STECR|nr:hypothetical protein L596_004802 [Steinernema carpocapsae]
MRAQEKSSQLPSAPAAVALAADCCCCCLRCHHPQKQKLKLRMRTTKQYGINTRPCSEYHLHGCYTHSRFL